MDAIKKRGRPKKLDMSYEDLLAVDKLDETKLVVTQTLEHGIAGGTFAMNRGYDSDGNEDYGGADHDFSGLE